MAGAHIFLAPVAQGVGVPGAKEEGPWGEPEFWGPKDPGSDSGSVTKVCDHEQVTWCLSLRFLFTELLSRLEETMYMMHLGYRRWSIKVNIPFSCILIMLILRNKKQLC